MGRKSKEDEVVDTPIEEFRKIHEGKVVISRITTNPELQVRKDGVDTKTVRDYSLALEDPLEDLPPIAVFTTATVFNNTCALMLSDGFHRITSYKQMNRTTIPVEVYYGDEFAAFIYSLQINGKHGLALTPKDHAFAVKLLLSKEESKDWSVRKIAGLVGCSKSTVQNIKNPPAPKRTTKAKPDPEPAENPVIQKEAAAIGEAHERFAPGESAPAPVSDGPAVQPPMVRERQESTLPTKDERLEQLKTWVREGHITRSDVMNIFSGPDGNMVFARSDLSLGKRILTIRHGNTILIEAEVTANVVMGGVIAVSVDKPQMVEYTADEDLFARTA